MGSSGSGLAAMPTRTRLYLFCLASGCIWAGVAYLLGHRALGRIIWGGLLASPVIGLSIGLAVRRFHALSTAGRIVVSLVDLYVAACIFGLAAGVFDVFTGSVSRNAIEVVLQSIIGVLWGVTFTGYVIFLWPLAYLNHALLWRQASECDAGEGSAASWR